jgi:putative oxidoreductase
MDMQDIALLVVRLVVGALFAGHGAQKLFGWFGGHGLAGTGAFFDSLGIRPGRTMALVAGLSEVVGGGLLVLGLFQPLAALLIGGAMVVAIAKVHGKNGVWAQNGGFEYNLVLLVIVLALAALGPGSLSLAALVRI